jgi:copper(I)-binding protein
VTAPGRLAEVCRAAAGPVACAVALTGLLSAWVATGGAGTLTRVSIQVTLVAVPMRAFTSNSADAVHSAGVYLTIRNVAGTPDELIAVRSPVSSHVVLITKAGPGGRPAAVAGFAVPADGTLTLSPVTADVVLENPVPFEARQAVPLTLVFRNAGQFTVNAPVTAPGTP